VQSSGLRRHDTARRATQCLSSKRNRIEPIQPRVGTDADAANCGPGAFHAAHRGLQVCLGLVPARPKNDGTFSVVVNLPIPRVYRPIEEKVPARVKLLLCVKNSFHSEPKLLSFRHCVGRFHSGSLASITNTSSTFIALALALVAFHPVTAAQAQTTDSPAEARAIANSLMLPKFQRDADGGLDALNNSFHGTQTAFISTWVPAHQP
jgi:hypothetical protein